jgi:hypothetical protein
MHYLGGTAITIIVRRVKFALELIIPIPTLFFLKPLFVCFENCTRAIRNR